MATRSPDDSRHRELDHTADVGFEVDAADPSGLFDEAARALLAALSYPEAKAGAEAERESEAGPASEPESDAGHDAPDDDDERIELGRGGGERLLVAWLREVMHRAQTGTGEPVPRDVRVWTPGKREDADGWRLTATLGPRPGDRRRPGREVKGITYHGLAVEERNGRWSARVILDV